MLNKKNRKRMKTLGVLSIFQIFILVVGIVAIGYVVGQEFTVVSANDHCNDESIGDGEPCRSEEEPPPPGSNLLTNVAAGVLQQELFNLYDRWRGYDETLSAEQLEILKESGLDLSETARAAAESGGPSFLGRYLFGKGSKEAAIKDSLRTSYVTVVVVIIWKFSSVFISTKDFERAGQAAGRVAIGAVAGQLAYVHLAPLLGLGPAGIVAIAFVAAGVWLSDKFLKRDRDRQIDFTCKPWQPQTGGDDCTLCNDLDFPCTEYQCKSLGTGCEIINKDTDNPRCIHKDDRDLNPPVITPWVDVLEEGYSYDPLPAGRGVEIKYLNEECLPAFTPFTLGIELDKEGYCKIESERTSSFKDMDFADFGGRNSFLTQHSNIMSFPGVVHIQDYLDKLELEEDAVIEITNDGEYEFYVRCQAATNGKAGEEFLFKFCIDKGPDTTAPVIRGFNWENQASIGHFSEGEERKVDVQAYVNKPSECKWSHEDKDFADMENGLTCSDNLLSFNAQLSYTCSGELTGLENSRENNFYFRCNDTFGNLNIQSKKLTLTGTQALIISEVSPNNTLIKGATDSIKIKLGAETIAGNNEGEATCSYSTTGASTSYIEFSDTNSHTHSTSLWLDQGNYNYFIRCIDVAGNADTKEITFGVESDTQAPNVIRVYREGQNLKIITNEESECVFSNFGCSYEFKEGTKMNSISNKEHFTKWDPDRSLYIKCRDEFLNEPSLPNSCSIEVRPFEN